jgi:hypothetical protein
VVAAVFAVVVPIILAVIGATWRISWLMSRQDVILTDLCARMIKVERAMNPQAEWRRRR